MAANGNAESDEPRIKVILARLLGRGGPDTNAESDEPRIEASQELIGSRSWVESNSDIEKPATSWPDQKSDGGCDPNAAPPRTQLTGAPRPCMDTEEDEVARPRRKWTWDLRGSRPYVESTSDIEQPATSWPRRKPD